MTFAIAGVSGNTGKVAAETLLAHGRDVRVIVRDAAKGEPWKAKGADVRVADLADAAALGRALEGAAGAYLLVPPNMGAPDFRAYQASVIEGLIGAVRASRVPHVVFLSSVGAQHPAGTGPIAGLHDAERAFARVEGTAFSFLRAAYFMENLGGSLGMLGQGVLPSFLPGDLAFDMIATRDIGALAAELLEQGRAAPRIVELGGPARSMNDAARELSTLTGKEIRVQEAPLEAMAPTLQSFGFPAELAGLYQEMTKGILDQHVIFEGTHARRAGTTPLADVLSGLLGGATRA